MRTKAKKGQVYRHYDKHGFLLYVGMSSTFLARQANHKESNWFDEISTITVAHYDTREEALDAERVAIATENPKHNLKRPAFTGAAGRDLSQMVADYPDIVIPWDIIIERARDYLEDEIAARELDNVEW